MAILMTEGLARPELDTAAELSTAPPPIVRTKPRRRMGTGSERAAIAAARGMWDLEDQRGTYLPSPETIAAECAAIRAGWSEAEHRYRAAMLPTLSEGRNATRLEGGLKRHWTPPVIGGWRGEA